MITKEVILSFSRLPFSWNFVAIQLLFILDSKKSTPSKHLQGIFEEALILQGYSFVEEEKLFHVTKVISH